MGQANSPCWFNEDRFPPPPPKQELPYLQPDSPPCFNEDLLPLAPKQFWPNLQPDSCFKDDRFPPPPPKQALPNLQPDPPPPRFDGDRLPLAPKQTWPNLPQKGSDSVAKQKAKMTRRKRLRKDLKEIKKSKSDFILKNLLRLWILFAIRLRPVCTSETLGSETVPIKKEGKEKHKIKRSEGTKNEKISVEQSTNCDRAKRLKDELRRKQETQKREENSSFVFFHTIWKGEGDHGSKNSDVQHEIHFGHKAAVGVAAVATNQQIPSSSSKRRSQTETMMMI